MIARVASSGIFSLAVTRSVSFEFPDELRVLVEQIGGFGAHDDSVARG